MVSLFLTYIFTLFILFLTGYFALKFLKVKFSTFSLLSFASLLLGLVFITTIYSFYQAKFYTIHLFLIPIFFYALKFIPQQKLNSSQSFNYKQVGFFFVIALYFFYQQLSVVRFDLDFVPDIDTFVYSNHVRSLFEFGVENNLFYVSNLLNLEVGLTPYHYLELWFAALITNVFGLEVVKGYHFIAISVYSTICALGTVALFEKVNKESKYNYILGVGAVFLGGLYLGDLGLPILNSSKYVANSLITDNIIAYPFVIAAFLLYLNHHKELSIITLLTIPLVSYATLPAIFGGVVMWVLLDKSFNRNQRLKFVTATFLLFLLLIVFYYFFGAKIGSRLNFNDLLPVYLYNGEGSIVDFIAKKFLVFAGLYPLKIVFAYSIPFLICYKSWSELRQFKFWFLIPLAGLGASFLFSPNHEATWLFRNIGIPILNVVLIYLFAFSFNTAKNLSVQLLLLSFLLISFGVTISKKYKLYHNEQVYSKAYLSEISNQFIGEENVVGGLFVSDTYFDSAFAKNPKSVLPAKYLLQYSQYAGVVNFTTSSITLSEKPDERRMDFRLIQSSDFEVFKNKNHINEEQKAVELFIKKYNLRFVIVDKGSELPEYLSNAVSKTIKDEKSGQLFLKLKN